MHVANIHRRAYGVGDYWDVDRVAHYSDLKLFKGFEVEIFLPVLLQGSNFRRCRVRRFSLGLSLLFVVNITKHVLLAAYTLKLSQYRLWRRHRLMIT